MKERLRLQQRLFKFALRKHVRKTVGADQQLIQLALVDRAVFEMAYEQAMEDLVAQSTAAAGFTVTRSSDGIAVADNLFKLLDWFVKNGPALIEIIKMISGLFGGVAEVSAILRQEGEMDMEEWL